MRPSGSEPLNLTGQLLVAHPNLRDPNFRKAVLFLSAHDREEGAHGLVLNRPTNKSLTDFLPDHELDALGQIPVYVGGPVGAHELTIVSFDWIAGEAKITFHSQLSLDQAQTLAGSGGSRLIRAFVGYAGWAGGQLESELQQSAWIVQPATEAILGDSSNNGIRLRLMKNLGPAFYLLAIAPDDPSLN
ncbi:MAG: YqgE/AlgH family protein [Verrucomicrobia bacterium]|nr:YqgE/AlgH family protein [Verrucomicrobiota bacterium]